MKNRSKDGTLLVGRCPWPAPFRLLVLLDFLLDRLFVHLHLARVLEEEREGLRALGHGEVLCAVEEDGVDVRLVLHRELQGRLPGVLADVEFDRAVDETALDEDLQSLVRLALEGEDGGRARLLRGQFFNVEHVLELINFLDGGVGNLRGVVVLARHGHGGEAGPELRVLDVAAEAQRRLPLPRGAEGAQLGRIGRHRHSHDRAVRPADGRARAREAHAPRHLAQVDGLLIGARAGEQVPIREGGLGVEPDEQLAVRQGEEHVVLVVPARGVHHRRELHHVGRVGDGGHVQVAVPVHDAELALEGVAHLVEEHLVDVQGVRELFAARTAGHRVEETHHFGRRPVHTSRRVPGHGEREVAHELGAQARELELGDGAALEGEDLHSREVVHRGEVLWRDLDHGHALLEVEDVRRVPVVHRIHEALRRCGHHQVPEAHGEVDDPVTELKLVHRVSQHVVDGHLGRLGEVYLVVTPRELAVHELPENHAAVAPRGGELGAIARPRDVHDRARVRCFPGDGPAGLVAEAEHVERTNRKVGAGGRPRDCGDGKVKRGGGVEVAAEAVPDLVLAVLAPGDDVVVHHVPVHGGDDAVVRLPLRLLRGRLVGFDHEVLARGEEQLLAVWGPGDVVYALVELRDRRPEHPVAVPGLDDAILAARCKRRAVVAPAEGNHRALVRLHALLHASHLVYKLEGTVCTRHYEDLLLLPVALARERREPVERGHKAVDFQELAQGLVVHGPAKNGLVIAAGDELVGERPAHGGGDLLVLASATAGKLELHAAHGGAVAPTACSRGPP
mmetsp:Transcript_9313/g.27127  ORF Transcript_9313/g.27127 Transcript_9313/m.27127 type:complete len:791 (+) Transcript_9313:232-2604(+)